MPTEEAVPEIAVLADGVVVQRQLPRISLLCVRCGSDTDAVLAKLYLTKEVAEFHAESVHFPRAGVKAVASGGRWNVYEVWACP